MYHIIIIMVANLLGFFLDFMIFISIFWHCNFYISVVAGKLLFSPFRQLPLWLSAGVCPVSACVAAVSLASSVDYNILLYLCDCHIPLTASHYVACHFALEICFLVSN